MSILPSNAESGGLLDDKDVTLDELKWCEWDYAGQQEPGLALFVHLTADDGEEADQYFSAGKLDRMVPSEDGENVVTAVGSTAKGINNNCNAFTFLNSLTDMGFPEEKILEADEAASVFVGTKCHVNRIPQKKRAGLVNQGGDDRQKTVLVVTKIIQFPWESKPSQKSRAAGAGGTSRTPMAHNTPAPAAAGRRSTPTAPATSANGDAINIEAIDAVIAALEKADGTLPKKKLGTEVFRILGQSDNRAEILQLVGTDEFLSQDGVPWQYDGTTIESV